MSDCDLHRLTVDLDPGREPIQGWLCRPGGVRQAFCGWLELASALEATRAGAELRLSDQEAPPAPVLDAPPPDHPTF